MRVGVTGAHPEQLRVVGAIDVETLSPAEVEAAMWELLPQRVTGFRTYPGQDALLLFICRSVCLCVCVSVCLCVCVFVCLCVCVSVSLATVVSSY